MPERQIPISLIVRALDDDVLVAEPVLFPEISCCDRNVDRLRTTVRELARKFLEGQPNFTLHQRMLGGEVAMERVLVTLDPPRKKLDWADPVELEFDVVRWRHASEAYLAYVPALGIEVAAAREADLRRMLPEHILAALRRQKISESLYELAITQRTESAEVTSLVAAANIKSPKQIEQDEGKDRPEKPAIEQVGVILNDAVLRQAFGVETLIEQIADSLRGRNPRSVLLIGPSGVGKTAAVHELVRRRSGLQLDVPFWATSGSRLIAGMSGFGMWQKRCQRLCSEAAKGGAILHLGNLIELMEVGRGGAGGQGIAGFLRPWLGRGEILAIAECTPEQLPLIERENPHLLEVFHQIRVEEPSPKTGRQILVECARAGGKSDTSADAPWLDTLDRLHRRYATYSAYPGRPVRFIDNLLKDVGAGAAHSALAQNDTGGPPVPREILPADVVAAFARETGLPRAMLDPDEPLDLAAARQWFAQRVIGQDRAVDLVTDLLATVKTSLTRPLRPIASLLFIGPTGVGKTELAKALAEYFFGDRNRLTRFDMSEFASPGAVDRLLGGAFGSEGLLTAKVREQPFSVILFDEFEKAHWSFFDLLLQVLGEARLTDAAGRLGDFSNAIVVMTSNLGAEAFGRGTFGLTKGGGFPDPESHFTDEVRAFLRPELFNRIDRIVPFLSLDEPTIRKVAEREISLASRRDGFVHRGLELELTPAALAHLTQKGYDIRYGARPLKRAIERELLAPLAQGVNQYAHDLKLHATADVKDGRLDVNVRAHVDVAGKTTTIAASGSSLAAVARDCTTLRRNVQRLDRCAALLAVQNQLFLLEREDRRKEQRRKKKKKEKEKVTFDSARAELTKQLKAISAPAQRLSTDVMTLEDEVVMAIYENEPAEPSAYRAHLFPLQLELDELLLALLARQVDKPHSLTLAVFGDRTFLWELARSYRSIALKAQCKIGVSFYRRRGKEQLERHSVPDVEQFLADPDDKAIGVALDVSGRYANLRFRGELGLHVFIEEGHEKMCMVDASETAIVNYAPPARVEFPEDPTGNARRKYHMEKQMAEDPALKERFDWTGRTFEPALQQAIEMRLRVDAWGVLNR